MSLFGRRRTSSREQISRLYSLGRHREAAIEAEAALRRFPDDAELHLLLARCVGEQDPERGIVAADRAVQLEPGNVSLLLDAAWVLILLNRDRSREILETASRLAPQEEPARGLLAYLQGRHAVLDRDAADAEFYFRKAVLNRPTSDVFAEALVELLVAQGRRDEAREISDAALETAAERDLLDAQRARLGL